MAKKPPVAPIRAISILVGVIIGCVFAYAYQANLPTLFYEMHMYGEVGLLYSLIVFIAIPMLAGFVIGLLYPVIAVRNGLYIGLISGLFNSIIATLKLIYAPALAPDEIYAFALFAITSVFVWMILAAVGAELASRSYE